MTHLQLIVPGLLWPTEPGRQALRDLPLPALRQLLSRSRRRAPSPATYENRIAQLFGVNTAEDRPALPFAAWRRLGETEVGDEDAAAHWLCADPVHLSLTREHLLLDEFSADEMDADTAAILVDALNTAFPDFGHFSAPTPTRWYLRLAQAAEATFSPVHDVAGRPMQHFLPEGEDGRKWRHALNEIQVLLHNHPLNTAREARGQRPINSLWFWGGGAAASAFAPNARYMNVQSSDPVVRGLARIAGAAVSMPDANTALAAPTSTPATLIVLDALAPPARRLDLDTWLTTLIAYENEWFAPVRQALNTGRPGTLDLLATGDEGSLDFHFGRGARWCFWRREQTVDRLLMTDRL
jgi:hypothetical protein